MQCPAMLQNSLLPNATWFWDEDYKKRPKNAWLNETLTFCHCCHNVGCPTHTVHKCRCAHYQTIHNGVQRTWTKKKSWTILIHLAFVKLIEKRKKGVRISKTKSMRLKQLGQIWQTWSLPFCYTVPIGTSYLRSYLANFSFNFQSFGVKGHQKLWTSNL